MRAAGVDRSKPSGGHQLPVRSEIANQELSRVSVSVLGIGGTAMIGRKTKVTVTWIRHRATRPTRVPQSMDGGLVPLASSSRQVITGLPEHVPAVFSKSVWPAIAVHARRRISVSLAVHGDCAPTTPGAEERAVVGGLARGGLGRDGGIEQPAEVPDRDGEQEHQRHDERELGDALAALADSAWDAWSSAATVDDDARSAKGQGLGSSKPEGSPLEVDPASRTGGARVAAGLVVRVGRVGSTAAPGRPSRPAGSLASSPLRRDLGASAR